MILWTKQHVQTLIPSLIVMLILSVVLRIFLGKKEEKIRLIPFQICTVFLFVIEIIKQIKSFKEGYDLYNIPLHFCSLFIYMLPLMSFYHGKYKDHVRGITTTLCGSLFLLMIIYPNLIYSGAAIDGTFKDFFDFHTVAFHTIATFTFFLIIALDLHDIHVKRDVRAIVIFMVVYCLIGGVMAQVLKTNFNNFYQCNIPPLQALKDAIQPSLGYPFTQALYVVIVSIVDLAFTQGAYQFYRLMCSLTLKIEGKLKKNN
jgi:hypothetical protein